MFLKDSRDSLGTQANYADQEERDQDGLYMFKEWMERQTTTNTRQQNKPVGESDKIKSSTWLKIFLKCEKTKLKQFYFCNEKN